MSERATIRVGGVPEHFNMPWHLALESHACARAGLDVEWTDYSTGTGAMLADLVAGRLEMAIVLTEGAALGLARGAPIHAVSLYTMSALIWGVHVAPAARFAEIGELDCPRFAISRPGSGSHLMALQLAIDQGWPSDALGFEVVDDMRGAAAALAARRADLFLWEHFTTEPAIERGQFRRIGDLVSPWPAWVVCVSRDCWSTQPGSVEALLTIVLDRAARLAEAADAAVSIAQRYGLRTTAVEEWLARTCWVGSLTSPDEALAAARDMLVRANAI